MGFSPLPPGLGSTWSSLRACDYCETRKTINPVPSFGVVDHRLEMLPFLVEVGLHYVPSRPGLVAHRSHVTRECSALCSNLGKVSRQVRLGLARRRLGFRLQVEYPLVKIDEVEPLSVQIVFTGLGEFFLSAVDIPVRRRLLVRIFLRGARCLIRFLSFGLSGLFSRKDQYAQRTDRRGRQNHPSHIHTSNGIIKQLSCRSGYDVRPRKGVEAL